MTVAIFVSTFLQWVLSIVIVHISDLETAGIYSLVYSFTSVFLTIAIFGNNNYQICDVTNAHTDGTYIAAKVVACALSLIVFAIAISFAGFSAYIVICCLALMCQNIIAALAGVLHAVLQKFKRYDIIAVSLILKGGLPTAAFCITLYFFNLFAALCASAVVYFLTLPFFDIHFVRKNQYFSKAVILKDVPHILFASLYLMLISLVSPFQLFFTKNIIKINFTEAELGGFSSITLFIHIIALVVYPITSVMLPELSAMYINKSYKAIKITFAKLYLIVTACGIFMLLGDHFAGAFVLKLILGDKIEPFTYLLFPTLIASLIFSMLSYVTVALTSFRKLKSLIVGTYMGGIICALITEPLVLRFGIVGSCYSLIISLSLQLIILNIIVFWVLRDKGAGDSSSVKS